MPHLMFNWCLQCVFRLYLLYLSHTTHGRVRRCSSVHVCGACNFIIYDQRNHHNRTKETDHWASIEEKAGAAQRILIDSHFHGIISAGWFSCQWIWIRCRSTRKRNICKWIKQIFSGAPALCGAHGPYSVRQNILQKPISIQWKTINMAY